MKNLDMAAQAQSIALDGEECITALTHLENDERLTGLTKREQACITLGIPESGDTELDALIIKSERKRIAENAMQGLLARGYSDLRNNMAGEQRLSNEAIRIADALLEELAK